MSTQYFASIWIIRYLITFKVLDEMIDELSNIGCDIVGLPLLYGHTREDIKFNTFTFCVKIPSPALFNDMATITKNKLGLEDWYPIEASTYEKGFSLDMRTMEGRNIIYLQKFLLKAGIHNASSQDAIENHGKENNFYAFHWIVTDTFPITLLAANTKSDELGCALYYLNIGRNNEYNSLIFGVRLPKNISIKAFFKHTNTINLFTNITPITDKEFYYGRKLTILGEKWNEHLGLSGLFNTLATENKRKRKS